MIPDRMNAAINSNPRLERNAVGLFCMCGHSMRYHRDHGECTICPCRHYKAKP